MSEAGTNGRAGVAPLRFCVVGAGAIGGFIAACLARGGADVSVVARGAHLAAMRERGICVRSGSESFTAAVHAVEDPRDAGAAECVVLALKAHQILPLLPAIATLLGPQTRVIAMQNGLPWWYFQRPDGAHAGLVLDSVDPGGRLAAAFDPARTIGCVIYCATEIEAPGVIRHIEGTRYSLGTPSGGVDPGLEAVAAAFHDGGLKAPIEEDLRPEVWVKLLGNAAFNPISALTHATLRAMTDDPGVAALVRAIMEECVAIASALGVRIPISIEKRIEAARRVGEHKTSMLQDLERGRALELDGLLGAVVELGARLAIPTPASAHVYALASLLDRGTRGSSSPSGANVRSASADGTT